MNLMHRSSSISTEGSPAVAALAWLSGVIFQASNLDWPPDPSSTIHKGCQ